MNFAQHVMQFTRSLRSDWPVPAGIEILFPYSEVQTVKVMEAFYHKYYGDSRPRTFLFGINPGRFGAGVTGVPFTDPVRLEERCGIANPFDKKQELSSVFVYHFIDAYGAIPEFYRHFYITSLSPLGFVKDGKNCNYYDDRKLQEAVEPFIIDNIRRQMAFGANRAAAICLGQGKNFKYFQRLNEQYNFFKEILPLPHPRWVMQYRLKRKQEFIELYLKTLNRALDQAEF